MGVNIQWLHSFSAKAPCVSHMATHPKTLTKNLNRNTAAVHRLRVEDALRSAPMTYFFAWARCCLSTPRERDLGLAGCSLGFTLRLAANASYFFYFTFICPKRIRSSPASLSLHASVRQQSTTNTNGINPQSMECCSACPPLSAVIGMLARQSTHNNNTLTGWISSVVLSFDYLLPL